MSDTELISVIIPVYNVKDYLDRCIKSVLGQTYSDLEIILVDDGSTDGSSEICDHYVGSDSRVKVIHRENGGLSEARNTALDHMKGAYLTFVDSDDFIHREAIERFYSVAKRFDADLIDCRMEYGCGSVFTAEDLDSEVQALVLEGSDVYFSIFARKHRKRMIPSCSKLYRSSVFQDIRFPAGKIHEDEFVIHHVLGQCKRIVLIEDKLYYHYTREGSIGTSKYSLRSLDALEAMEDRRNYFEKMGDSRLLFLCYKDYLRRLQFHYYSVKKHLPHERDIAEKIRDDYKTIYRQSYKKMNADERIRYGLFLILPGINKHLRQMGGAVKV